MASTFKLVFANKNGWLLALAALFGDLWALLSFSPFSVDPSGWTIFFLLFSFIGELALFYNNFHWLEKRPASLVDSFMTGVAFLPELLISRLVLFIFPAAALTAVLIAAPFFFIGPMPILAAIVLLALVMLATQTATFFTCAEIMIKDTPFGEAISRGLGMFWSHKRLLAGRLLPFLLVDLALIGGLFGSGAITHDSMFIWTVTQDMARANRDVGLDNPRLTRAGDYFVMNRPEQGYFLSLARDRGPELLSLAYPMTSSIPVGLLVILISYPLLLLRMAVLTRCYHEFIRPPQTA